LELTKLAFQKDGYEWGQLKICHLHSVDVPMNVSRKQ
jgi:hypothetical protein